MTANAMAGDREKALAAGMNDHIAKPVNVATLFQTMARWIRPARPAARVQTGKTALAQTEPLRLAGIDTVAGLKRVQGNRLLYLSLLRKTARSQADSLAHFDAAAAGGDWTAARRIIHSLKGVAGNLGADALQQACARLETTAAAGHADAAARMAVQRELRHFLAAIATLPAGGDEEERQRPRDPESAQALNQARLDQLTAELSELIAGSNFIAATRLREERQLLIAAGLSEVLESLEDALEVYDFEAAQTLIGRLEHRDTTL
jgi:HPt (histidine-containing phosphotransfer) domain-containing protein